MNSKFEKLITSVNCSSFIFNENNQVGNSFGEKLTNSIQEIYSKGFQKVIVIGNDCPALNSTILQSAITSLQTNSVVVGPNYNGGLYLIGINKENFTKEDFQQLNWQTNTLHSNFKNYFDGAIVELKTLNDLNNFKDIQDFIVNSTSSFIRNLLLSFQLTFLFFYSFIHQILSLIVIKNPLNKGSPVVLYS